MLRILKVSFVKRKSSRLVLTCKEFPEKLFEVKYKEDE